MAAERILAGFAEIVKCGFIGDPAILDTIEASIERVTDPGAAEFRDVVERSIALKARVVSADFKESGLREILNYGHTIGHAIENLSGFAIPHGKAICIGIAVVNELAVARGILARSDHERVLRLIDWIVDRPTWRRLGRTEHRRVVQRRCATSGMMPPDLISTPPSTMSKDRYWRTCRRT